MRPICLEHSSTRAAGSSVLSESHVHGLAVGGGQWCNHTNEPTTFRIRSPELVSDLGTLPFEVGHGSALTPLPPNWSPAVGAKGGLFIIAGCSPSNHEGWGPPSDRYAIYDAASGKFTLGRLPNVTGAGTSAVFHGGKVIVKRGGVRYGPADKELWTVTPLSPDRAQAAADLIKRQRMNLKKVNYLAIQFDSSGEAPFDIFLDGLTFE